MRVLKIAGFAAACAALAALLFHYALAVPPYYDDNDGLTRFKHPPTWFGESVAYWWAIDHPAVYRWVNWGALRAAHIEIGDIPAIDTSKSPQWNRENGRLAPRGPVNFLRCVNVVWLMGALACLILLGRIALGSAWWGLLIVAPIALNRKFGGGVGSFIFTDAHLAFFLALMLLLWVRAHISGRGLSWRSVITIGLVAGLAISSKYNAALALLAYGAYLAAWSRGAMRLWRPLAFFAAAFAVFVAVNPIMWQGAPLSWSDTLYDMFKRRLDAIAIQKDYYGATTLGEKLGVIFLVKGMPFGAGYVLPPAVYAACAYLVWRARHDAWFAPVALWAGFLAVGTVLTIHETFPRYLMPIQMPLTVLAMMSAVSAYIAKKGGSITVRITAPASSAARK